jgi:6-phospho-beta-glucosidase
MDIDEERLQIVGEFAQRMAAAKNARFSVHLSTNQQEAIRDSAYVITQLRVGKMQARREDEYLGKRHGLIGQETTGVGGMAKALRTIPVILGIARDVQNLAPGALLVNFANPSGLVTEALSRYAPEVSSVGVCNATITTKMEILKALNTHLGTSFTPQEAHIKALGLNHLTWFYGFEIQGQDYWQQIIKLLIDQMSQEEDPYFDQQTLEILQMLPNSYLRYYYYTKKMLEKQNHWPPSRAEEIFEIETDLLNQYREPDRIDPPADLIKRGGAYYSTVATQLLNAHNNNLDEIHVVDVRHNGAVPGWDKDWVLELPCRVNSQGIEPLPAEPLPIVCESLVARVKAYEILTAEAAVTGDRKAAYQALLAHPLGPPADQISTVLEDMLNINRQYLPQFFS